MTFIAAICFIFEFKGLNGRFTTRQTLHSKVENIFAGGSRLVGQWLAQRIRNRQFQVSCPSAGIHWFNNTSLYLPFFLSLFSSSLISLFFRHAVLIERTQALGGSRCWTFIYYTHICVLVPVPELCSHTLV